MMTYKKAILVVCIIMVAFGGCGKSEENASSVNLAIIAGVHSNSYEVPLSSPAIYNQLYQVSYTYGQVTFLNCDGDPTVYYQTQILPPAIEGLSKEKLDAIAKDYATQLQNYLGQATASVPEVDTLKAVTKAAQALRSTSSEGNRILLVLDSGLSTAGYLDFTKGLLNANTEDIITALEDKKAIPDLKGVYVYWSFCGETAYPQEELSMEQKAKLAEIWYAVLKAGGASDVIFTNDFTSSTAYIGLPDVSFVDAASREIIVPDVEPIETIILDSESVRFEGDSDQFVDINTAQETISKVANLLQKYTDNKIYIVGTTATGREVYCRELSEARADAVKNMLIEFGIPERQLFTVGLGCNDYWHKDDQDENGHLIESIAEQNRKVLIIDANSADAVKIGIDPDL